MLDVEHEAERRYAFLKKGKKYKAKYFMAVKGLYGEVKHDKESQLGSDRGAGTGIVRDLVEKAGN